MSRAAKRAEDLKFLATVTEYAERVVDVSDEGFSFEAALNIGTMKMQWETFDEQEIPVRNIHSWLQRALETLCDDETVIVWESLYFLVKKYVIDPKTKLASILVYDIPDQQHKVYFFR